MTQIDGANILVTGATGGIGEAIARRLAASNARLVLSGRRADVLEKLAADVGGRAIPADLDDQASIDRLLTAAGEVDILVANAALPSSGTLDSFTVEQIDRALNVNLRAPIVLTRALLPAMLDRGRGHLVYISSIAGKVATLRSPMYSATKFGLRGFAGSLRADVRGTGVGVSAIFPGFIRDAGMFHDAGAKLPAGVGTRRPVDVAAAVVSAITRNRGEVDVASVEQRAGSLLAALSPELALIVQDKVGRRVADELTRGQQDKR